MITVAQAAAIVGVSQRVILRQIQRERLPARRFGERWALIRRDVEAFARQPRPTGVHRTPRTPKTSQ